MRKQNHYKAWKIYEEARYCKMVFSANDSLNGKLMVEIKSKKGALVTVFKWPKHWNKDLYDY